MWDQRANDVLVRNPGFRPHQARRLFGHEESLVSNSEEVFKLIILV